MEGVRHIASTWCVDRSIQHYRFFVKRRNPIRRFPDQQPDVEFTVKNRVERSDRGSSNVAGNAKPASVADGQQVLLGTAQLCSRKPSEFAEPTVAQELRPLRNSTSLPTRRLLGRRKHARIKRLRVVAS